MRFCGERPSGRSRGAIWMAWPPGDPPSFASSVPSWPCGAPFERAYPSCLPCPGFQRLQVRQGWPVPLAASSPCPCHLHFFVHFLHRLHLAIKGVRCWRGSGCRERLGGNATALCITGVVTCVFVRRFWRLRDGTARHEKGCQQPSDDIQTHDGLLVGSTAA